VLRRHRALVLITIGLALVAAFLGTPRQNQYEAEAQLYVGSRSVDLDPDSQDVSGNRAAGLSFLASSFADMLDTRSVAERALAVTGVSRTIEEVENAVTASTQPATLLVTITVVDRDPSVAAELANGVADEFVGLLQEQEDLQSGGPEADRVAPVSVFERAVLPTKPLSNSLARNLFLAAVFGTFLAVGVVVLLEYLDLTIKNADDAQNRLQLPVLGALPLDPVSARGSA
jgi:capsular polysaccharide biosynthesis protein